MPNRPEKHSSGSLRARLGDAARLTAEQQAASRERPRGARQGATGSTRPVGRKAPKGMPKTKSKGTIAKEIQMAESSHVATQKSVASFAAHLPKGRLRIVAIVVCVLLLCVVFLYPVGQTYYQSMRQQQQLQAQLDAVNAYNAQVKAQNEALNTDEGVENQARKDLGWVEKGESSAVVTNSSASDSSESKTDEADIDKIKAPDTWYYDILDVIFFVKQ